MKKYIGIISVVFAMMAVVGCKKESSPIDPGLVDTPLRVSVGIDDESGDTKTTLVEGHKVYWETGDKFYGFHKYGNDQTEVLEFTLIEGAGSKTAVFESDIPHRMVAAGDVMIGIYGCTLNEAGTLPMWPSQQFASTTGTSMTGTTERNISAVPMFAKTIASATDTFADMTFKNGGGLLQINVNNNTEADINPDMLYIDSKNVHICGEFNLPTFDSEGTPSIDFTSNGGHTIAWKFDDVSRVVGTKTIVSLNVAVPAGTYSGLKFTYTGNFGTIPYGFVRSMKDGASVTIHRSKIDKLSMDLYKNNPIGPDSPVGTIGTFTDLSDPHQKAGRTGMIVGFDFTSGTPKTKLIICTANLIFSDSQHKVEDLNNEAAWKVGSLVKYNVTNSWTSGGHWRLMSVAEAREVMETDEHGTGKAQWGTLNGVQGIYWYFDPTRYFQYGANVVPNSIFLPVTHNNASEDGRAEGRYWLEGDYYFEFWQNPAKLGEGVVNVIYDKDLSTSDHLGAIRLVHDELYYTGTETPIQ